MSAVIYDAAVLIAADRNERWAWTEHKARLEMGIVSSVPAVIVAQVSRSSKQVQLRRFLKGCSVTPLDEEEAHKVGHLLGISKTADVADAVLVISAVRQKAIVLTGDPDDINRLVRASGCLVSVVAV